MSQAFRVFAITCGLFLMWSLTAVEKSVQYCQTLRDLPMADLQAGSGWSASKNKCCLHHSHLYIFFLPNPDHHIDQYRTRMANSTLKCRIIILITARSFCSYNNILIIIRHPRTILTENSAS